ncbi:uncharacterized protein L201_005731 [Kwoniella dendrophila CBS 6074]|uniref:Uncharacterized protein n=1 Tax=Kwoniella dendrophila CBS 6074 TaxID=1295534 RepID=A0AAX4K037_9TREE
MAIAGYEECGQLPSKWRPKGKFDINNVSEYKKILDKYSRPVFLTTAFIDICVDEKLNKEILEGVPTKITAISKEVLECDDTGIIRDLIEDETWLKLDQVARIVDPYVQHQVSTIKHEEYLAKRQSMESMSLLKEIKHEIFVVFIMLSGIFIAASVGFMWYSLSFC